MSPHAGTSVAQVTTKRLRNLALLCPTRSDPGPARPAVRSDPLSPTGTMRHTPGTGSFDHSSDRTTAKRWGLLGAWPCHKLPQPTHPRVDSLPHGALDRRYLTDGANAGTVDQLNLDIDQFNHTEKVIGHDSRLCPCRQHLAGHPLDHPGQTVDLVAQDQYDVFMSLGTAPQPPSTLPQYEKGSRSHVESPTGAGQAPHSRSS